jgi:hypothetical protein
MHAAHDVGVDTCDHDLVARARTQLGDVARRQGRHSWALRLLESAERPVAAAGAEAQVRHARVMARTYAELGDRKSFAQAIDTAWSTASMVPSEDRREGCHGPAGVQLERGQGLTLLGEPRSALRIYAEAALPGEEGDREHGSFVIIHAQALAHSGDLDEGVRRAVHGLALARSYGSARHISRVQRMHDRLAQHWSPREPLLRELREALAS